MMYVYFLIILDGIMYDNTGGRINAVSFVRWLEYFVWCCKNFTANSEFQG
jgi:hypothetical protein